MEGSLSFRQQALFAQKKLDNYYTITCMKLEPIKEAVKLLQEAILWRKPVLSLTLYISVHLLFWYLYCLTDTLLTFVGRVMFWSLLVDGFWMIATRDKTINESTKPARRRAQLHRIRIQRKRTSYMTLEEAVIAKDTPLEGVAEINSHTYTKHLIGKMEGSLSFRQQALFAQKKLDNYYTITCMKLEPIKEAIKLLQEAILWRKPVLSLTLYISVHLLFWYLYCLTDTLLTFVGRVMFWSLLVDGFWMIATRDKTINESTKPAGRRAQLHRIRVQRKRTNYMTLEEAVIAKDTPLEIGQVAKFEVVCLWIAIALMWLDNVQLAMRHWNREQPYMLAVLLFTLGCLFCSIGYFIASGLLIMYFIVLFSLIWPINEYYNLISRSYQSIVTHYPMLNEKLQTTYRVAISYFHKLPDEEFRDFQLQGPSVSLEPNSVLQPGGVIEVGTEVMPSADATGHPSNAHSNNLLPPYTSDVSMTLPPFDSSIMNPMDSLASFMPNAGGFNFPSDDSLALGQPSYNNVNQHNRLSHIQEISKEEYEGDLVSMTDINPQILPTNEGFSGDHRDRGNTLTLTPFNDGQNPLRDSFDDIIDDNVPLASTDSQPYSTGSYSNGRSNDFMGSNYQESPFFKSQFNMLGSGLIQSSTPLDEGGTLRNRQPYNNNYNTEQY